MPATRLGIFLRCVLPTRVRGNNSRIPSLALLKHPLVRVLQVMWIIWLINYLIFHNWIYEDKCWWSEYLFFGLVLQTLVGSRLTLDTSDFYIRLDSFIDWFYTRNRKYKSTRENKKHTTFAQGGESIRRFDSYTAISFRKQALRGFDFVSTTHFLSLWGYSAHRLREC